MLLLDRPLPGRSPAAAAPRREARLRGTPAVLAAALLATVALRLPYLHLPLGIDEGGVAFIAKAWGSGHGSLYGAYWLDRPPLLVALYKVAVLAGPVGIRILGALAAVALVVATTAAARAVAGDRAAKVAAVLSGVMASSVAMSSVFSPAELLAAAPAAASIGCLAGAHRDGRAGWLVGAGLLAVAAALIKQSFLDAGFAGAVFLVASGAAQRRPPIRWALAYAAGALVPLAGVAAWLLIAHVRAGTLVYAVAGFRIHALHTLAASSVPLHVRVRSLIVPGELSGLFLALPVALGGFWALRRDRVLAVTLAAWLTAGTVGVLGGGSYWSHYLIQLIAPAGVLAGAALAAAWSPARAAATIAIAAVSVVATIGGLTMARVTKQHHGVVAVARYVRDHARPGDTQYVMYARANVGYYTGLPSPYPYAWSLMVRAVPGAIGRLDRLLDSPRRPTWIVGWQRARSWGLDPHGTTRRALHRHYRVVARVHGHPIWHRKAAP
jgi:4-amino-4-deoxy-L-arabinose transferase-like glycosyltransferase